MKNMILISLLGTFCAATAAEMHDATTHEQLVVTYRQASQQDPMRKLKPAKGHEPAAVSQPKDLISDSDIICYNGLVTIVPKQAVLQIPKNLADRFKYHLGSKMVSWGDFYALNRGWITTVEVSRSQAAGNTPISEDTRKQMVKSGNLIVATYQTGPISVLPLKVTAEPTKVATETAAKTTKP